MSKWKEFYRADDVDTFRCIICSKQFKGQGNCVQHIKRVHFHRNTDQSDTSLKTNDESIFTDENGVPIKQGIVDLLVWRAKYGVSRKSITDKTFQKLTSFKIPSEKILSKLQHSIANQILKIHKQRFKNKFISLTLDGGTVIHYKWLAIGVTYKCGSTIEVDLLDVVICEEKVTADFINEKLKELSTDMKDNFQCIISSCCTDNGSNFVKTFNQYYFPQLQIFVSLVRVIQSN